MLPRLFHEFPAGRSGAGLLLLRIAVAVAVVLQAAPAMLSDVVHFSGSWMVALLAFVAAVLLVLGLLTPIAAAGAALQTIGLWTSALPPDSGVPHLTSLEALLTALLAAVALLGPGAFSIDARLFGLREIIIPRGRSGA